MGKRSLSVLLVLSLVITLLTPTSVLGSNYYAAVEQSTEICQAIGMVVGTGSGLTPTYLASTPKRYQGAKLIVGLRGYLADAESYAYTHNFTDSMDLTWVGGRNILGYLKANPSIGYNGKPDGSFAPNDNMTIKEYYKLMLVSLGYIENTDFSWTGSSTVPDVMTLASSVGLILLNEYESFTMEKLCVATTEALKATRKGSTETLADWLVVQGAIDASIVSTYNLGAVTFADAGFEARVRTYYELGDNVINQSDLTYRETLDLGSSTIGTLEDLKWFPNLSSLTADWDAPISGNLSSLSGLINLDTLILANTKVTGSLSNLSGMDYLRQLTLPNTLITGNLSAINSMYYLEDINFSNCNITGNISNLSNLYYLNNLQLGNTNVTGNLSSLSDLTAFSGILSLDNTAVTGDLSSLKDFTQVDWLFLHETAITGDISNLSDMYNLGYLQLGHTNVSGSISSLNSLINLTDIDIYNNSHITGDLSSLSNLKQLNRINLSNTSITGTLTLADGTVVSGK